MERLQDAEVGEDHASALDRYADRLELSSGKCDRIRIGQRFGRRKSDRFQERTAAVQREGAAFGGAVTERHSKPRLEAAAGIGSVFAFMQHKLKILPVGIRLRMSGDRFKGRVAGGKDHLQSAALTVARFVSVGVKALVSALRGKVKADSGNQRALFAEDGGAVLRIDAAVFKL